MFKGVEWTFIFSVNAQDLHILADLINVHNQEVTLNTTERLLTLRDQVATISAEGGWQRGLSAITSNIIEFSCSFHFFDNLEQYTPHIRHFLTGVSGCYYFYNLVNANGYVGSSTNMRARFVSHARFRTLTKGTGRQIIHDALVKYGSVNFSYLCFLLSSGLSPDISSIACLAQEQFLMHHLANIIYNISKLADRPEVSSGADHKSYNTGFPLYLYKVQADDWHISKGTYYTPVTSEDQEFIKVFPNVSRAKEELGIPAPRMYRYQTYYDKPIKVNFGNYKGIYFVSKTPWH